MLRKRVAIAQDVVKHLADAERSNDLALVSTARLVASMLEARLELNVAAMVGQDAFEAVASTFERQSASRRQLVEAHNALADAKKFVGLAEVAIGGGGDKQVPSVTGALRVVDAAEAA
jgi:hypothetical protein